MQIINFRHKGLRQLYEDDSAKGVPAAIVDKLKKMLFTIETAKTVDQVASFLAGGCIF